MCDGVYAEESRLNVIQRTMSKIVVAVLDGADAQRPAGQISWAFFAVDHGRSSRSQMEVHLQRLKLSNLNADRP